MPLLGCLHTNSISTLNFSALLSVLFFKDNLKHVFLCLGEMQLHKQRVNTLSAVSSI